MKKEISYFLFNLALLIAFSYFAFSHNPGRLFIGNDGPMVLALIQEQIGHFGFTTELRNNFQQGIGNLSFPINLTFVPGFWLPFMDGAGHFTPAPMYTWFACLMFVTVLLVAWNYAFPRGMAYGAAWLLTILMFPYFEKYFAIYAVTASSPMFIWYLFSVAISDIGIRRMGGSWPRTAYYAGVLLLGIFFMLAASPAAVILMAPFLAASFLVHFLRADKQTRLFKLGGAMAVFVLCLALGWVEYVAGLLLYSSSGFFLEELQTTYSASREFASILFQGGIADRAFGPVLFVLATIGAMRAVRCNIFKEAAIITLAGQILHALIAAQALAWVGGWTGPPPIYTEMTFFALYALFAAYALAPLRVWRRLSGYAWPVITCAFMATFLLLRPAMVERNMLQSYAMLPAPTAITDYLAKHIATTPGAPFNGRVASVLPGGLAQQMRYAYQLNVGVKNDHATDGLWLFNIPTLTEYNQTITPAFYRIVRRFLTLPNDKQNRSWTNFSYTDTRILRMLGVRYLLSFDPQRNDAILREKLELKGARTLYLLELKGANTSGMSIDELHYVDSVQDAETIMQLPSFSGNKAVVMGNQHEILLDPVASSSITLENGGYRIQAQSNGKSLLIMPIEYSRCMDIEPLGAAQAVRVNVALTGLVFDRQMDILLKTRIGPFTHPRCRLHDWRDFKTMWKE